jgi:hypothetical protein
MFGLLLLNFHAVVFSLRRSRRCQFAARSEGIYLPGDILRHARPNSKHFHAINCRPKKHFENRCLHGNLRSLSSTE